MSLLSVVIVMDMVILIVIIVTQLDATSVLSVGELGEMNAIHVMVLVATFGVVNNVHGAGDVVMMIVPLATVEAMTIALCVGGAVITTVLHAMDMATCFALIATEKVG